MAGYEQTIDWTDYWESADGSDREAADASGMYLVDPLMEFFEGRGIPDSYADVGCGPASTVFAVADRWPDTSAVGYDAAEAVLAENRDHLDDAGYSNVRFEQAMLPSFEPESQFDVVSCFYTLCYVPETERALRNLYAAVEPGGYLVITYHNQYASSMFASIAEQPHEFLDESSAWNPDTFAERFAGVIEGETTLSYREIHAVLGAWPQSLWSVVETERYDAWRQNPLVFVPKPQ